MRLVNNLLLVRLQNALENAFLPFQKAINPKGYWVIFDARTAVWPRFLAARIAF